VSATPYRAGAKALACSAHREAVTCFERALRALPPPDARQQQVEDAIDLRPDLRQSVFPLNAPGGEPLVRACSNS